MTNLARGMILAVVGAGVAGVLVLRRQAVQVPAPPVEQVEASGPRLVELGSTSCTSCKAMHEELALLRQECGSSIGVEEINVWEDEAAAAPYGVQVIPTQVLLDGDGREFDRHVGFLSRADIRQRFAERGVECRP